MRQQAIGWAEKCKLLQMPFPMIFRRLSGLKEVHIAAESHVRQMRLLLLDIQVLLRYLNLIQVIVSAVKMLTQEWVNS